MAQVISETVVADFNADLTASGAADHHYHQLSATVASDRRALAMATAVATAAAARIPPAVAQLTAARRQGSAYLRQLVNDRRQLTVALAALTGPAPAPGSGLSLLGPAALNAGQLVAWFNAQGYADLTATSIAQLAKWYLRAGALEGIRGDVAFAQAVLETGGFSSPDAVNLNNYAGIGHCDSCPAGWPFPSPQGGVIGQLQLLRIFADSGEPPRGAPAPVLPALTAGREGQSGCCPTWESLTGVWATDPTYGTQILDLYQGMLSQATIATPASSPASRP
jgi:hypothetical protein